ncbi:SET domain-containing protein [Patescibacteria group bacterium]|nr:SET domain-containing protein [Patescibacteria group bacterium]
MMKKTKAEDNKINEALKDHLKVKRGVDGLGLFAEQPIKKGEYLIEYWGPLLTDEEVEKKGGQYLFEVKKNVTIDGTHRANTARYINHSCRPNCEVSIKKGRVLVYTKKAIKAGEELGYDYGKDFWNEYIKPKGCRCIKCKEVGTLIAPKQ